MGRRQPKTPGKKIRVQAVLEPELVEAIDDLAERMGMTRSYMIAELIKAAVQDEGWIIKFITSKVMAPVTALIQKLGGKPGRELLEQYERDLAEAEKEDE